MDPHQFNVDPDSAFQLNPDTPFHFSVDPDRIQLLKITRIRIRSPGCRPLANKIFIEKISHFSHKWWLHNAVHIRKMEYWARICNRLRSLGIDTKESNPPGYESILGLLKRFTSSGPAASIWPDSLCFIEISEGAIRNNLQYRYHVHWGFFSLKQYGE